MNEITQRRETEMADQTETNSETQTKEPIEITKVERGEVEITKVERGRNY